MPSRRVVEWMLLATLSLSLAFGEASGHKIQRSAVSARQIGPMTIERLSVLDSLLKLGREHHIPMGIEYVDRELVERQITVSLNRTTVSKAMDSILQHAQGYHWRAEDGVIIITNKGTPRGPQNLLDRVLPNFVIPQVTIGEASHVLWMTLHADVHPGTKGWVGSYSPGISRQRVGPLNLQKVTTRQVLNKLVAAHGDSAWAVKVPPEYLGRMPSSGLWVIVEYETGPQPYAPLLRQNLLSFGPAPAKGNEKPRP